LFITCADSRVSPGLLTQSDPGELFIHRNVGNLIPHVDDPHVGEAATLQYAVEVLKVKDIIICGHTDCGAVKGLLNPDKIKTLSDVSAWLEQTQKTQQLIKDKYSHLEGKTLLNAAIQENVLAQLEHVMSYPNIKKQIDSGDIKLHGWVYDIKDGNVLAYNPNTGQFTSLTNKEPSPTA